MYQKWRTLIGQPDPDTHMKDIEIILRGFAMLIDGENYKPTMTQFLNKFSENAKNMPKKILTTWRVYSVRFWINAYH